MVDCLSFMLNNKRDNHLANELIALHAYEEWAEEDDGDDEFADEANPTLRVIDGDEFAERYLLDEEAGDNLSVAREQAFDYFWNK